jgi:hypothetical protein
MTNPCSSRCHLDISTLQDLYVVQGIFMLDLSAPEFEKSFSDKANVFLISNLHYVAEDFKLSMRVGSKSFGWSCGPHGE